MPEQHWVFRLKGLGGQGAVFKVKGKRLQKVVVARFLRDAYQVRARRIPVSAC